MSPTGVRNTSPGPTVFVDPEHNTQLEWAGAGHPSGEDIHMVPDEVLDNVHFMRAMTRGVLVKVDDAKAKEAMDQAANSWRAAQTDKGTQALAAIEDAPAEDLVSVGCHGPGMGGRNCEASVILKAGDISKAPPLCDKHKGLEDQFEVVHTDSGKRRWMRKS
jgi:hypothetical protein